ncbi:MAG: LLM class F420-dependent oxidoreductase [Candidatus Dormibacteraeota bacterium]|nr:LLM class F420-dependent oxidoreductase [Candidatus Dormibacteraeota bacterium]
MKLGITVPYADYLPREMVVGFVKEADRLGYDCAWVPEAYGWDAFTICTQLALATERIRIGTGIVNVFSRSPALLGQTAASLDLISRGRFILGLGTSGHQVIEGWHGVKFERGVRRMRETIDIVRMVLKRERLKYDGEIFRLGEGLSRGLKLITQPIRDAVPIYLATLTPSGVALAGEVADGWLPVFFSPGHFSKGLRAGLEKGAARGGRTLGDMSVCPVQPVVVTDDRRAGRDAVRPHLALYIGGMGSREKNYYNQLWCSYGYRDEAIRIQDLYLDGRKDEAMQAVSDEMVDLVTIIGSAGECRERIEELARAGVSEVSLAISVPDLDPAQTVEALRALAPR